MTDRRTTLWAVIAFVIAIVAIVLIAAAFFAPTADFQFDWQHMMMGRAWVWWTALIAIVVMVVIILTVVVLILALRPHTPRAPYYPPTPRWEYDQVAERKREVLDVLGQRYARGEITEIEYLRAKDELR
jgi:uncharacterized membrane protein